MPLDDDLRGALSDRAAAEPTTDPGALGEIHHRIRRVQRRRQAAVAGGAAVLVLALAAAALIAAGGDDNDSDLLVSPGSSTTAVLPGIGPSTTGTLFDPAVTSDTPTSSSAAPRGPTTTFAPPVTGVSTTVPMNPSGPYLWPSPSRNAGSTPKDVALDFAKTFAGMATPIVAAERPAGDMAEVDIKAIQTSTRLTTVGLHQVEGRWMVVSARGGSIIVDTPTSGQDISSPVRVAGQCNTFEGHVSIEVRRRFATTAIGRGSGTGMQGDLGPYEASVSYQGTGPGAVVVSEPRADDENAGPLQFTAVLVTL